MLSTFGSGRLFGTRLGSGKPRVLALHGWQRDHRDLLTALDGLDAIAVDLPGFGASPAPDRAWGSARYASEIAGVLDEMATPVVVFGHSFGGRVALQLAAAEPDRVGAVVLSGVPGLWPRPDEDDTRSKSPAAFRVGRWLHRRGLMGDARMESLRRKYGSADYRAASGVLRDVLVTVVNERYDDVLGSLSMPVSLVWGAEDSAAPVSAVSLAAGALNHVRLTVLPGIDHFTPTHAADALHAAVLAMLAEIDEAAT